MAATVAKLVSTLKYRETVYTILPEGWPGRYTRVERPRSPNFLSKRMDVYVENRSLRGLTVLVQPDDLFGRLDVHTSTSKKK